jgi:hypothetical protein
VRIVGIVKRGSGITKAGRNRGRPLMCVIGWVIFPMSIKSPVAKPRRNCSIALVATYLLQSLSASCDIYSRFSSTVCQAHSIPLCDQWSDYDVCFEMLYAGLKSSASFCFNNMLLHAKEPGFHSNAPCLLSCLHTQRWAANSHGPYPIRGARFRHFYYLDSFGSEELMRMLI